MLRYGLVADPSNHLWLEDGRIFLTDAPDVTALVQPYAGYLSTLPRLIALVAAWVPLALTPVAFALATAAVTGACAAIAWRASEDHVPSIEWRILAAGSFALIPIAGMVPLLSASYLQWILIPGATWALLLPPRYRRVTLAALIATVSSSIVSVLALLPTAALLGRRQMKDVGVVLPLWFVQVPFALTSTRVGGRDEGGLVQHLFFDVGGGMISTRHLPAYFGAAVIIAALLASVQTRAAGAFAFGATVHFLALVALNGSGTIRYAVPTALMLIAASAIALGRRKRIAVAVLTIWTFSLPAITYQNAGTGWRESLDAAPCIGDVQKVPISPPSERWYALVPC